jgi:Rieske Fe-S protein
MTVQRHTLLVAALGVLAMGTPQAFAQAQGVTNPEAAASEEMAPGAQEQSEQEIPLAEVPEAALAAAKKALEAEPKEAYLVTLISGEEVYELEATSSAGEEIAVYVTPAGEIVEREKEQGEESE